MLTLGDMQQGCFDHIVMEMSGIADPFAVRAKFQEAAMYGMPMMERVRLDTMVTVVDCGTFWDYYQSAEKIRDTPELRSPGVEKEEDDESLIPTGLRATLGMASSSSPDEESPVASLLMRQVETADILLLNKMDLVNDTEDTRRMKMILNALNGRATVYGTEQSRVPWRKILGAAQAKGVAQAGIIDDHKESVQQASMHQPEHKEAHHHHEHSHSSHGGAQQATKNNHQAHSHDHHEHHHREDQQQHKVNDSHHQHNHHSHSSTHGEDHSGHTAAGHDHSHDHSPQYVGNIGSFVYRARRPFHPTRLAAWVQHLPVPQRGLPSTTTAPLNSHSAVADDHGDTTTTETHAMLQQVIRSKGFYWQADSHAAALFWSQAGCTLDLTCLGSWWATWPRYRWPAAGVEQILADFDDPDHQEQDDATVGDRRQEIVFIGPSLGDDKAQRLITASLDQCLLTDQEWELYWENRANENALKRIFPSPFALQVML